MKHTIHLLEDDDDDLNDDVAPDVSEAFTSAEEVNEVLRQFLREKKAA